MSMSVGETVLLIGLMVNAAAIILSGWLNSRKVNLVITDVKKIELATNSMKDELVEASKDAARLQGEKEAREALKKETAQQKKK